MGVFELPKTAYLSKGWPIREVNSIRRQRPWLYQYEEIKGVPTWGRGGRLEACKLVDLTGLCAAIVTV